MISCIWDEFRGPLKGYIKKRVANEEDAEDILQDVFIKINNLPEKYREAILLSEFEKLSQKEMSKKLGISISGVKSRVQRGRKILKEMLLGCCHLEFDSLGHVIDYEHKEKQCRFCKKKDV